MQVHRNHISLRLKSTQALCECIFLAFCYLIMTMKTIDEIRRANLAALAAELGGVGALAKRASKSDSQISQWLNGSANSGTGKPRGMRSSSCREIETACGKQSGWMEVDRSPSGPTQHNDSTSSIIHVISPGDQIPDGFIQIPESKIEFSAGNGRTAHYELVVDEEPATYRLDWFQKYGINPERVRRFRVHGDSMEPMLYARDTILVNLAETSVVDGKLYAIRYGDELRVKYLSRRLDGTLLLRSVNPAYSIEEVAPELVNEHITVIGRVRDTSGTGGL